MEYKLESAEVKTTTHLRVGRGIQKRCSSRVCFMGCLERVLLKYKLECVEVKSSVLKV